MSLSAPFIARPIATCLLAIAVLLGGALGYNALPVSALPQVDFPTIVVTTLYPGAGPETMATLVTAPLERQLGQINGLTTMQSSSAVGVSQITLQFDLTRSIDGAAQDVQAAINAAQGVLPASLPYPPTYNRVNPADAPILSLAITSDTRADRPGGRRRRHAAAAQARPDRGCRPRGRAGRAEAGDPRADRSGAPGRLRPVDGGRAHGHRHRQCQPAPRAASTARTWPTPSGTNDQLVTPAAYANLILAWRAGAAVRLSDVGTVVHGVENDRVAAWYQGPPRPCCWTCSASRVPTSWAR